LVSEREEENPMTGWRFYTTLYVLTVPVFFLVDLLWLGVVAKGFYRRHLDPIINFQVNWPVAVAFYLVYITGIIYFAVRPALAGDSIFQAIMIGALFGFFTYATYDLTNWATIADWPCTIVIVDLLWGTVLCATVSGLSFGIAKWLQ